MLQGHGAGAKHILAMRSLHINHVFKVGGVQFIGLMRYYCPSPEKKFRKVYPLWRPPPKSYVKSWGPVHFLFGGSGPPLTPSGCAHDINRTSLNRCAQLQHAAFIHTCKLGRKYCEGRSRSICEWGRTWRTANGHVGLGTQGDGIGFGVRLQV